MAPLGQYLPASSITNCDWLWCKYFPLLMRSPTDIENIHMTVSITLKSWKSGIQGFHIHVEVVFDVAVELLL